MILGIQTRRERASKRVARIAFWCCAFALLAFFFVDASYGQPPRDGRRPGGAKTERSSNPRAGRMGAPGDRGLGGRPGRFEQNAPNAGAPNGAASNVPAPDGDESYDEGDDSDRRSGQDEEPTILGDGQVAPAEGGMEGAVEGGEGAPDAQGQGDPRGEKEIPLADAIKNAPNGTTPIRLDQNDFIASDGVKVTGTYYRGKGDANTAVVVLLHDLGGKAEDFTKVAQLLAQDGYGVLIPDLRGSGGSGVVQRGPRDNNPPNDRPQMKDKISQRDIYAMIDVDRYLWFNFLTYLNNNEYCNIKKTILVGSGFGAALAASWAKSDWNSKDLVKQNVVGLALLSPDASNDSGKYNALSSLEAVRKRAKGDMMGFVVFVGQLNEDKFKDAQTIQQKVGGKQDADAAPEDRVCPIVALKTEKQGDDLLRFESFGVPTTLRQFVANRLKKLPKKRDKWEEIVEKGSRR